MSTKFFQSKVPGIILGILFLFSTTATLAQSNSASPFYPDIPYNEIWSANSQKFVFYDTAAGDLEESVQISTPNWLEYDVTTQETTNQNTWPLQPTLTDDERQTFDVSTNPDGRESFIYESPDGRFLVYGKGNETDDSGRWSIGIADRQQGQAVTLPIHVWDPFSGPRYFKVLWSADSKAFAANFLSDDGTPVFVHVGGYEADLSGAVVNWFSISVKDRNFYPFGGYGQDIFALSGDGSHVLLTSNEETAEDPSSPVKLLLWDVLNPDASQIIDSLDGGKIGATSFVPGDETKLLILNDAGLMLYDLSNGESTQITTDINTESTQRAAFSPDGNWLVSVTGDGAFMMNVKDLLAFAPTGT